jgi:L-asparaginase/archaeal Glu-tRNAGln amidotransferase subunit D
MTGTEHNEFAIPTWWRQSAFLEFKQHYIKKKTPLFFVGSGLSINAGLPTWKELLLKLAQIHDDQSPGTASIRSVISHRLERPTLDQSQYLLAGTDIQNAFRRDVGPDACRYAINSLLNDESRLVKASPTHDTIAALRWSRIITTNYDTLLERAARVGARRYKVLTTHPEREDFWDAEPVESNRRLILKIHGDIADASSTLVLSAESFERRYRGADQEKYTTVLRTVLRSSSVILFLGYGHNDPYFRILFNTVLNYAAVRHNVFALLPREGDHDQFAAQIGELSAEQIRVITYSPDHGHLELLQFLKYFTDPTGHDARYERNIRVRRPTVIMLHCGGTIGSAPAQAAADAHDHLQVVVKHSRYDAGLNDFSERLLKWYNASYNSGETLEIDIRWEILPPADQMFSENATYALWNALTAKLDDIIYKYFHAASDPDGLITDERLVELYKQERSQYERSGHTHELTEHVWRDDFSRRYILGIIVLFGTDTLTFATGALGVSLQHLPCPVVITGANQPPREENLAATRGQFYATSDAWTNLMNAIYFLQCFGHRMTEMFVCFGNTVHNAVNLRKRGAEIIPAGHGWRTRRHNEPFAFRNLSLRGQYMFKLIDGLFCNNYYPNPIHYELMVLDPEFRDMRHIRFDAMSLDPPKATVSESFLPRVTYSDVSPCFPLIDLERMVQRGL